MTERGVNTKKEHLTIVVPCYNEEQTVGLFIDEIIKIKPRLHGVFVEVLFVNDGSKDHTLTKLKVLHQRHSDWVSYINFSRNFGKEAGIIAGLAHAKGDYVALMDADLQDPPHLLIEMYNGITKDGYDIVGTKRVDREGEPPIRSFFAEMYYKLNNKIADVQLEEGVRDYRLMTREVVDAVLSLPERNRFSKGLLSWVGYDVKYLDYYNVERSAGETSWSFWQLFKYAVDGIISFSDVPLTITSLLGLLIFSFATLYGLYVFISTLIFGNTIDGWPSLAVLITAMGGLQMFALGVVGKYVGKIYTETKQRPLYIVKDYQPVLPNKE